MLDYGKVDKLSKQANLVDEQAMELERQIKVEEELEEEVESEQSEYEEVIDSDNTVRRIKKISKD